MKQVKMNLSEELKTYFKSQDDCKKKQNLKKACKVLFVLGGGIGCFMLGSKYCELCISRGLKKIYSNYPDVEKVMFESLYVHWRDTCDGKQFVIMWSDHTWETIRCPFTDYWIGTKSYKQYMDLNKVVSGKMSKEEAMKFINEKFESFR